MTFSFSKYRPGAMVVLALAVTLTGCSTVPRYKWRTTGELVQAERAPLATSLATFRGDNGKPIQWGDLLAATDWADVILIGEVHKDAVAHQFQKEYFDEVLRREPRTTLSLEFLERNEQQLIDDYLAGTITQEDFIEKTKSENGSGPDGWVKWYQPLVDSAKAANTRVIGANPPRQYARQARTEGYDALRQLPAEVQPFFTLPTTEPTPREYKLFRDQMEGSARGHGNDASSVTDELVDSFLRAQELWNSTMAASILAEHDRGAPKIVQIVGGFHIEENGGIVRELRHNNPQLKILTIQIDPELTEPFLGRADVLIHSKEVVAP